jgi:tetratricopeptide (TPR) repeat protein
MNPEETDENTVPEESAAEEEADPNLQEVDEEDEATLDKLEKEGGELAEFDLEAQIEEFRNALEEEPDNCVHHYNLAEALEELGDREAAKAEYERALECDTEKDFHAIIHFGMGNLIYHQLLAGIQSIVVKSSVGLHSAHKPGDSIVEVYDEDYSIPIHHFQKAMEFLPQLKADEELVDYISKEAPVQLANIYYKWASDLIDKSRQIANYGAEIQDVQKALKLMKKALDIDPNHSQANLMSKYAKKMLAEGWKAFDEYGFEAKDIPGLG